MKSRELRIFTYCALAAVIICAFFMPWEIVQDMEDFAELSMFQLLFGSGSISFGYMYFFWFLPLLGVCTFIGGLAGSRPFRFFSLYLALFTTVLTGVFVLAIPSVCLGAWLSLIAGIVLLVLSIYDIIGHYRECKWLVLPGIFIILWLIFTTLAVWAIGSNVADFNFVLSLIIAAFATLTAIYFISRGLYPASENPVEEKPENRTQEPVKSQASGDPEAHHVPKPIAERMAHAVPLATDQTPSTEELETRYAPKPVAPETKVHITPPASTQQEQATTPQPVTPVPTVKKSQPLILWAGIAVLLFAAGAAIYYIFIGRSTNNTAVDNPNNVSMYTYSGLNTNLRSSDDPNSAILAKLSYGVPLLVEKQTQGWVQVKYNNTTGYVSLDYLLSEDDYLLLNSIFGDANTQACLDESRYRRALLDYFKTNRLYGDPAGRPDESPYSGFQAGWQVYTLQKGSKPNTVLFVGNKEYQDMAVIIRNKNTGQRKCLLFAFDQTTKQPTLIHEEDAPLTGYIQDVTSRYADGKALIKIAYTN